MRHLSLVNEFLWFMDHLSRLTRPLQDDLSGIEYSMEIKTPSPLRKCFINPDWDEKIQSYVRIIGAF